MGISALRRNNFILFTVSTGSKTDPAQYPFIIILVIPAKTGGVHSSTSFIFTFSRNHSITGPLEYP